MNRAIGTDFSPVLIDKAKREAEASSSAGKPSQVEFYVARNETLTPDITAALGETDSALMNHFDFIFGVNTFRYCHRGRAEIECARGIFGLLAPGGVCVVIDMNHRFPMYRSQLRQRLSSGAKPDPTECYVPTLGEYTRPFVEAGFEIHRSENFCWIPHSAGVGLTTAIRILSPVLDLAARPRAMRSLVVARKPE